MQNIDVEQLKKDLIAAKRPRRPFSNLRAVGTSGGSPGNGSQREANQLMRTFFTKAGLDIAKLDTLLARSQSGARAAFEQEQAQAAKHAASDKAAYLHGIASRNAALTQLKSQNPAAPSAYIELDTPILILQTPQYDPSMNLQTEIEAGNNRAKFKIDTSSGTVQTAFVFYFLWRNESAYYAVMNVQSSLILNGGCYVEGDAGYFSGDSSGLDLSVELSPTEYWNQPPTLPYYEASQGQGIISLYAKGTSGGSWINDTYADQGMTFSYAPYGVYYNLFGVPAGKVALFEVTLNVTYGFNGATGDSADKVSADFASGDNGVVCPFVQLELLTAPPNAS
jgi:hypothetical protein